MAFVSPLQGHIDVALSNFAVKFRNPAYVSDQVFTRVPVQRQSDKYWRFGKEQLQALIDDLRVRDADITWDSGTGLYSLPGYLVKDTASSQDSGGAGGSSGGGSGGGIGCVLEGTEIVPLTHAMRVTSEENQSWIEIELADGRRLTATPDHPIYTDRGKTPLRLVEVGEGVVTDKGIVAAARIAPLQRPGRKLVVSMQRGHLFWANGVLSHNLKPLV